jgi:hypothetical protein
VRQFTPPCAPAIGDDLSFQTACQAAGYQVLACDQCGITSLCSGDIGSH